jgi:polar amino acid transport system substrate-binding protein
MQILLRALCTAALLAAAPLPAQDLACGSDYVVKRGDTLSGLAKAAYGRGSAYQTLFDYNPGVLDNPNVLPIGATLFIPCLGGGDDGRGQALSPLPEQKPGASALKILTGSDYKPYVDKSLPNGGFSAELIRRSLQAGGAGTDYRIDFINDWGAHLQPLLSEGCYGLGFPWYKPDCSQRERLGPNSRWRCDNLLFSQPLHEVVITFYGRPGLARAVKTVEDLHGKRICRPQGYFTHDLEAMGLVPHAIERVEPDSPTECFRKLVAGEVDVVTVNADTSDRALTELGIRDKVRELIQFATIQTLHAVGMKDDPGTRVHLLRIDKGLTELKRSGAYRQIAKEHL